VAHGSEYAVNLRHHVVITSSPSSPLPVGVADNGAMWLAAWAAFVGADPIDGRRATLALRRGRIAAYRGSPDLLRRYDDTTVEGVMIRCYQKRIIVEYEFRVCPAYGCL